ncbi:MAG TPA: hypothetical protein VMY37_07055 [Thermoguttaceae bacterium]|nr:hypothetical protein [Thermoguttaceae bacterium]
MSRARRLLCDIQQSAAKGYEAWQHARRWEIVRYHYQNNPFYRAKIGSRLPSEWDSLPVITKADLQQPLCKLLPVGITRRQLYTASTSGSSGHPFYFAKDKLCHALSWALVRDRYAQYSLTTTSKQARFYGIPLDPKGYLTEKVKDRIANRVRFPVFDLSTEVLRQYERRFRRRGFEYVYGYTSSIVYFARYLLDRGVVLKDICPTLRVCIVTSEVCTPEDRKIIETAFGVRVANEYGASELGVLAFERPDGEMVCSDEITFFEIARRENGENSLLCTSLFNKAFPLIRYELGDCVELFERRGRKYVRSIDGRVNDFAVLPSGRVAAGLTFYYVSRRILESSGCLREFIVRQTRPDTFVFDVVSDRRLTDREIGGIRAGMDRYLEPGLALEVNYVDHIRREGSGKIKHFFSELAQPAAGGIHGQSVVA